jgi:hypothetical protein
LRRLDDALNSVLVSGFQLAPDLAFDAISYQLA